MKKPYWEPSEGSLLTWLTANLRARPVDVWTIMLQSGTVLRYSGADVPVAIPNVTWVLGPNLSRTRVRQTIGVSVDTMQVTLCASAAVTVGGVPILQALAAGAFGGATIRVDRAFVDDLAGCQGIVPVFQGRMGALDITRSHARFEVRSEAEQLDVMVPGDVYQPACRNTVFDSHCGLIASAHTIVGITAAAGDTARRVLTSTTAAVIGKPAAWADLGTITFASGLNAGISRSVRTHVLSGGVATITALTPFPYDIAQNTSFQLRAGCNKVKGGDCTVKFNNLINFRGEPYIPAPETVL